LGISCQISSQVLLHIAFYLKNRLLNIKQLIQINLLLFNRTQVLSIILTFINVILMLVNTSGRLRSTSEPLRTLIRRVIPLVVWGRFEVES